MPDFQFQLPPITELTPMQQLALRQQEALLVDGGPGSGKTVVSVYRFLLRTGKNSRDALFFTFNRTLMASIRGLLQANAEFLMPDATPDEAKAISQSQVQSLFDWYYSQCDKAIFQPYDVGIIGSKLSQHVQTHRQNKYTEVFVDESQDLHPSIIESLQHLASTVSAGADRSQDLQRHYTRPADDAIFDLLSSYQDTKRQTLTQNFRNTREIFAFARQFVPEDIRVQQLDLTELPEGDAPEILGGLDRQAQFQKIIDIVKAFPGDNVGIILHSRSEIDSLRNFFIKQGYECDGSGDENNSFSYYYKGMDFYHQKSTETKLCTPFMLTYESCKGLEFDVVILPVFDSVNWGLTGFRPGANGQPQLDARGNPMTWTTPNHYYVAATRARKQLYILFDGAPAAFSFLG